MNMMMLSTRTISQASVHNKENVPPFEVVHEVVGLKPSRPVAAKVEKSTATATTVRKTVGGGRGSVAIRLPRYLPRPALKAGCEWRLGDDLDGVPLRYVRDRIVEGGASMLATLSRCQPVADTLVSATSGLPQELEYLIQDISSDLIIPPTHILALAIPSNPSRCSFFPTHALVLRALCRNAPALFSCSSSSSSSSSENSRRTTSLPVVPLSLPSPSTFHILHGYLYTQNTNALLSSLLDLPGSSLSNHHCLSFHLSIKFNNTSLFKMITRIHGLWSNACSLGVDDSALYETINLAWKVTRAALCGKGIRQN